MIAARAENGFDVYEVKLPDGIPKLREFNYEKILTPLVHELKNLGFQVACLFSLSCTLPLSSLSFACWSCS